MGGCCSTISHSNFSNKWEVVAPLKTPRDGVGVAILSDKIYAVGGFDRAYLNSVECFDPRVSKSVMLPFFECCIL